MAIALRPDFDSLGLRLAARASDDPNQVRRLLALAAIYDGSTRREAAAIGGGDLTDRSGLGVEVQFVRSGGPDRPQGAWKTTVARRETPVGSCGDH